MAWTTTQLLAHVRRVASLPTTTTMVGYTDADLLVHADAALQGRVGPLVSNVRDEHAVSTVDVAVASGQVSVRLPPRVAAGRLRDVTMLASDGITYLNVPRFEPEDIAGVGRFNPGVSPQSIAVVVQAGFLRVFPAPTAALTLRISYVRTPPSLAAVSTCTAVTGLTVAAVQLTASHAGTLSAGNWDFVLTSNGDSLGDSVATIVTNPGSTTFLNSQLSPLFSQVQAEANRYVTEGVYLCPAGTSCVVPLPDALSPLLAYRTAISMMAAIGDDEAASKAEKTADRMEAQLIPLLSERIEGEAQTIRPVMHSRGRNWRW